VRAGAGRSAARRPPAARSPATAAARQAHGQRGRPDR